ncbi:hypothetical protein chiPu_0022186 [Chiloscyllium punctatum]|uniref:Uncharacterized protein n=1 Tax=Chiloscyllium punctatum TaxID=137246 RepID=A0A401RDW1_CHIPU|nr:hypothetical protein [Chiloscyllium punctatum]
MDYDKRASRGERMGRYGSERKKEEVPDTRDHDYRDMDYRSYDREYECDGGKEYLQQDYRNYDQSEVAFEPLRDLVLEY